MYRKRHWPAIAAGYAAFLVTLGALGSFVYENAVPANRPAVIRLAVCLVAAVALLHLRRHFRGDPLWDPPSEFEQALSAEPPHPKLHPEFVRLREEVANALGRQSSFERMLGPRLEELARVRGGTIDATVPPLRKRRRPSPQMVDELITRIESRE